MLLADALGVEAFKRRVKIYATDVDDDALAQAREAKYSPDKLKEVSAERLERYFLPNGNGFVFRTELRRCVIFGRNDLHQDPPISRVDLLFARNTLMYFSPEVQERIVVNFHFALNRGGVLVVGKAESLPSRSTLFDPVDLKRRVFVRNATAEPGFRIRRATTLPDLVPDDSGLLELNEAAFEHAPVEQFVVDEGNRVIAVNQSARALFGLKLKDVGRPLQDLEVSYRPLDLRSLIDEARKERRQTSAKQISWHTPKGAERSLDVQVSPLLGSGDRLVGVGVSFVDVTLHRALVEQLERARRELQRAYEELQSTVEELETTNEELQSTNEELETINDELRDRTDETVRANTFLTSVLASMQQVVVVVDRELKVLAWNKQATELWGLRDDEVEGAHLLNLDIGLPVGELRDPVRKVLSGTEADAVVLDGHDRLGHRLQYTVEFAPLEGRVVDDDVPGAMLLLSSQRTG